MQAATCLWAVGMIFAIFAILRKHWTITPTDLIEIEATKSEAYRDITIGVRKC
jgi:hypothetical protein